MLELLLYFDAERLLVLSNIALDNGKLEISKTAMRKGQGKMTTIKLDKNFNIQIHGGERYIERGYDLEGTPRLDTDTVHKIV